VKTGAILQSGRFTATPDQLTHALDAHKQRLDKLDVGSRVILLTEMSPNKYDNTLADWADHNGWHVHHPVTTGPDECAILSQRPFRRQSYFLLTHLRLDKRVTNRTAPLFVTAAKPQGDDWFAVWHSPAHNQGLRPGNHATRVYRSALGGLKAWRMRIGGRPTLAGDWNADARRKRVQDILLARFPKMQWAGTGKQRPTEGGRVIDGFVTRRRVIERARTLPAMDGFDHRAVICVLG